eukprot:258430-Pleurochrysis_carterae.AAC.1
MQMDHANAKDTKKDVRANAVWVSSPSSLTTPQRNRRCPRSARQQTSSLFPRERCMLAWIQGSARSCSYQFCRAGVKERPINMLMPGHTPRRTRACMSTTTGTPRV